MKDCRKAGVALEEVLLIALRKAIKTGKAAGKCADVTATA